MDAMTEARETITEATGVAHNDMANAIRALAMDAVQAAKSGHPGMPMGMADVATVLFREALRFDAADPNWPNRDRFVLSAGHGSMLLYALLYLTGYPGMEIGELKRFRQLGSKTAGHPEHGHAAGIETTTGPLGQGLANAVGMALSERLLNARLGDDVIDHHTYVIAGDGCLMEGISHEAISLAGHLGLGKLIVLFDDNGISIDGPTSLSVTDDQVARFKASRLERRGDRRPRPEGDLGGAGEGTRGFFEAVAHRLQDDHRLRRADQGRQGFDAWRAAGRGRDQRRAREARLAAPAVRRSRAGAARLARRRSARRQGARELEVALGAGRPRCCRRARRPCRIDAQDCRRREGHRAPPRPRRLAMRRSAPPACGRSWRSSTSCRCCPS